MAKVETVRLVDDISGDEAQETVDFGLDGRRFRIDLTAAHARRLRDDLAPFLAAARAADSPGSQRARTRAATAGSGSDGATREHNRVVREWARENGFTVSERGRIPAEVAEAYRRDEPAAADPPPATEPEPAGTAGAGRPQAPAVEFSG